MRYPEAAIAARFGSEQAGTNTWIYKSIVGMTPEQYTANQIANLDSLNMSYYTTINGTPVVAGAAKAASGEWTDVEVFIHWLEVEIQNEVFNLLLSVPKISQTIAGRELIAHRIREVLSRAASPSIGGITNRFKVESVTPTQRDRETRNASFTFKAQLTGAVHTVWINGTLTA